MSDYKEIWDTLSQVDVSRICRREDESVLSFMGRAWYLLCQNYPDAKYLYMSQRNLRMALWKLLSL